MMSLLTSYPTMASPKAPPWAFNNISRSYHKYKRSYIYPTLGMDVNLK